MSQSLRAVCDLPRKHMQVVQLLSIGSCLAQQTGEQVDGDRIKALTGADIGKMPVGASGVMLTVVIITSGITLCWCAGVL